MNEFPYQRRIMALIAILVVFGGIVFFTCFLNHPSWGAGWLLGGALGLAVFRLRVASIMALPHMEPERWRAQTIKSGMFGLALLIAGGVVAVLLPKMFEPWAYVGGAVLERAVLVLDGMFRPIACPVSETEPSDTENRG